VKRRIKDIKSVLGLFLVLPLIWFPLSGCTSDAEKKSEHLQRAQQFISQSQLKDAVIELKNVIQIDPNDGDAHFQLAETYMQLKELDLAAQSYANAAKVDPENMKAHLKLGRILIMARRTMGAKLAARSVLDKYPKNVSALQLLASAQFQEDNLAGAIKTLQEAAKNEPRNLQPRMFLAQMLAFSGDTDEAEKTYLQAISIDPSDPVPYVSLARLYGDKEQWNRVLVVINQMGPATAKGLSHLTRLAQFCEDRKKWEIAEKIYLKASKVADKNPGFLVAFGAHYAKRGEHSKALELMQHAHGIRPNDPTILANLGGIHLELDQLDAANSVVNKALKIDGEHALANYTKGRILFLQKDFMRALPRFDQTINKSPQNAMAYYYKALCQLGKGMGNQADTDLFRAAAGKLEDQETWARGLAQANLHTALELDPNLLQARLVLAEIYLELKEAQKARKQIEAALALAPDFLKSVALLGSLKIMEKDYKGAEKICKKVLEKKPDSSLWHGRLGIVYSAMNRPTEALKAYQRALELDPFRFPALKSMVNIHLNLGNFNKAQKICAKQKALVRKNRILVSKIEILEGTIRMARGDEKAAVQHFSQAKADAPELVKPRMALAEAFVRHKNLDDAVTEYQGVLEVKPDHLPAYMALGYIYYKQGDKRKAEKFYRKALEINSDHGQAANNLAFILSERDDKLREAYLLAQMAEKQMPRNASVKDTLGWLYYRVRDYPQAITKLKASLNLDPDDALANYHIGLAYYQNKQFKKAREHLKKALKLDPGFEGANDAKALLD